MTCGTFSIPKVNAVDLAPNLALFESSVPPPTSCTAVADGAGSYTITIVYPPCPPLTTHIAAGAAAVVATPAKTD